MITKDYSLQVDNLHTGFWT